MSPSSYSGYSSGGSIRGAPSDGWSVISDQDDRRSSIGSFHGDERSAAKRTSFAAAAMSVLPDSFIPEPPARHDT